MNLKRLGRSPIMVSDICMGTMTFGTMADEKTSFAIMDRAVEAGVNFLDTAEIYPVPPHQKYYGESERIIGRWMKARKNREQLILASKIAGPAHGWGDAPMRGEMSVMDRHHIRRAVETSLTNLQTDVIDLYQTHWPDHEARYEDTLYALDELVAEGKIRIIGCSNETSWGLMKSLAVAEREGLARYETIQNNFSLNNRRFQSDLAQICRKEGVSLLPYSPIAGGVLSGKYNDGKRPKGARFTAYLDAGTRQQTMASRFVNEKSLESAQRFARIAADIGVSPVTLAVAWSKQHDFVASSIIGATKLAQMDELLAAADLVLNKETRARINETSREIMYPMG